jgi:transcriptional regulator with GAF, ATPase, and Fis domain
VSAGRDGGAPFWIVSGLDDAELAEVRRAISTRIIAEAIASGRTVSTASAVEDPRFRAQASVQAQRLQAVICAPVGHDPSIGVVYLAGRAVPGPFPEADRAHVELFARHLAPLADRLLAREAAATTADHTDELRRRLSVEGVAGTSRALAEVFRQLLVAAPVPVAVLITGESGTGKTALARALHESSPRARGPFVELNCAAIPEGLFESELFGAEKGAHSTATRRVEGKVDAARGGTLFLDEVGDMPLEMQAKLLRVLQEREIERVGGNEVIKVDVRVVAATNRDIEAAVKAGQFRADLFDRLNVLPLSLPPLRARRDDIPLLAKHFLGLATKANGRAGMHLTAAALDKLVAYGFPGNVRELKNLIERMVILTPDDTIDEADVKNCLGSAGASPAVSGLFRAGVPLKVLVDDAERSILEEALTHHGGKMTAVSRSLGLERSNAYQKCKRLGVRYKDDGEGEGDG